MTRKVCIELLPEGGADEDEVGLFLMSLGTRDAASNFLKEARKFMANCGFAESRYNPLCTARRRSSEPGLVHGGDFVSSGRQGGLDWLRETSVRMSKGKSK